MNTRKRRLMFGGILSALIMIGASPVALTATAATAAANSPTSAVACYAQKLDHATAISRCRDSQVATTHRVVIECAGDAKGNIYGDWVGSRSTSFAQCYNSVLQSIRSYSVQTRADCIASTFDAACTRTAERKAT